MREIARYRQLDQAQITQTLRRLRDRISERFPGSGLANVAGELVALSEEAFDRIDYVRRPNWPIRIAVGAVIAGMVTVVGLVAVSIRISGKVNTVSELVQTLDASINDLVFLGVAIFFLVTLEARLKRRKALTSLHQLRSVVHIGRHAPADEGPGASHVAAAGHDVIARALDDRARTRPLPRLLQRDAVADE